LEQHGGEQLAPTCPLNHVSRQTRSAESRGFLPHHGKRRCQWQRLLRSFGPPFLSGLFILTECYLTVDPVFLEPLGLGLLFFDIGFALDAVTGKRDDL
jgi:hypothetical protein